MARIAFEKIMAGLEDALAYADGDASRGTAHEVKKIAGVDITPLREKLGLSQDRFAALFGLSARTVRKNESKGFDLYSGHLINTSATHCALYSKAKGVNIFPLSNVLRMVIHENTGAFCSKPPVPCVAQ
ncbi:MAG: hypothetical protein P4L44_03035 [Oryzomonas sp.]|uniref:helix-turn-helix domain-containing protein n=1 Tax=Oryzomonas sp. TaxID=2855186 RepID=UPI002844219B|nr:hypothetical protein [Oryzomonas sp.]MDR3578920.1 hypothetical protein [Oryzomonas sp.]